MTGQKLAEKLSTYLVVGSSNTSPASSSKTDASAGSLRPLVDVIGAAVAGGISTVQLREKTPAGETLDAGEFLANAISASELIWRRNFAEISQDLPKSPILTESERIANQEQDPKSPILTTSADLPLFIINDRVDIAIALRLGGHFVSGVHIGQADLPPAAVRQMLSKIGWEDALIGLSCRDEPAIERAAKEFAAGNVDYVGTGPVRTTASKPNMPPGLGYQRWGELRAFAKELAPKMPVVAIGGVVPGDADELVDAGADGLCCITFISQAPDVFAASSELVSAVKAAKKRKGDQ